VSRVTIAISSAVIAVAALIVVPGPGAGAGSATTACVAWAAVRPRIALGPRPAVVRTTLHGSAACAGVTTENGGSATLDGPGGSTSNYPMRWSHIGSSDTVEFYRGITEPGTYRFRSGDLQTYDAEYVHIPYTWRPTSATVRYAGRFTTISRAGARVSATLQYYAEFGWQSHAGVRTKLQRRDTRSHNWVTVASRRSSSAGRISFRVGSGQYRLASVTTGLVWGTAHGVAGTAGRA
jgi:hypothetical protein